MKTFLKGKTLMKISKFFKYAFLFGILAVIGDRTDSHAAQVVAPNANETVPGGLQSPSPFRRGSNALGNGAGAHNQIVYSSDFFTGTGSPISITAFSLRPLSDFLGSDVSITQTTIRLSTTSASESTLSETFADNLGADAQVVFDGALTIDSTPTPASGGTNAFDQIVTLQTPFVYDPSEGNLLLDVVVPVDATVTTNGFFGSLAFDTVNLPADGIGSVVNLTDGDATGGTVSTAAAVTQFTFDVVPEPASLSMLLLGTLGFALRRR